MKQIIYILFLIIPNILVGQTLPPPVLQNVSVIENTGQVQVEWSISDSAHIHVQRDTIDGNWLYRKNIDSVKNINLSTYTDRFSDADKRSVSFRLEAYLNSLTEQEWNWSNLFNTTYLEMETDSCGGKIDLTWTRYNRYIGYDDQTPREYNVYRKINGDAYSLIHTTTDTVFSDYDVQESSTHTYMVGTVLEEFPNLESRSNTVSDYVNIPRTPGYIYSPVITGQNDILLVQFKIDPTSGLEEYKLLRSDVVDGTYDTIFTFNTTEKTVQTNDQSIDVTSQSMFYQLVAINECGRTLKHSDTINNVVLSYEQEGKIVRLNWNRFKPNSSNINYEIYRSDGVYSPVMIDVLTDTYEFSESLNDIPNNETLNEFCYYVRAQESGNDTSCIAQSNTICVYNNPAVYMPTGFTPNGDMRNDEFAPKITFEPESYLFQIYNKWGNELFTTKDYNRAWDGRDKSGKLVSAGVYLYYLTLKSPNGSEVKKSGTVTVIFP